MQAPEDRKNHDLWTPQIKSEAIASQRFGKLEFTVLTCFWKRSIISICFFYKENIVLFRTFKDLKSCSDFVPSEAITEGKFLARMSDLPFEFSEKLKEKIVWWAVWRWSYDKYWECCGKLSLCVFFPFAEIPYFRLCLDSYCIINFVETIYLTFEGTSCTW